MPPKFRRAKLSAEERVEKPWLIGQAPRLRRISSGLR
jgi:hypothetical protein